MDARDREGLKDELRAMAAGRGDGLDLDTRDRWVVGGLEDAAGFFRHLDVLLAEPGTILYFGIADDRTARPGAEPPAEAAATEQEPTFPRVDLRDPRAARHYLRAALSGYRAKPPP